ncbi:hypothetical protein JW916_14920 [Candidatus Sumerlaeota bacterium]|nr:hypothetical protein [Candidatus Sumerlaeota bacterium]
MKRLARIAILAFALLLTLVLAGTACGFAGTWGVLQAMGRNLVLSSSHVKFWPDSWPAVALYAWAAPLHLAAALAILFGLLPLCLALLERVFLALDSSPDAPDDER